MRRIALLAVVVVLIGVGQVETTLGVWAPIYGVDILPDPPSTTDPLTIFAYGDIGSTDMYIDHTVFSMVGTLQELDIFFDSLGIGLPIVVPWSHSESIGTLPAETYSLTVRTYEFNQLADTYVTSFAVVPEPSADFDEDGDVDGADFLSWQINDGSPPGLDEWKATFGNDASSITASSTGVPEPTTGLLLMLGMASLLFRRHLEAS